MYSFPSKTAALLLLVCFPATMMARPAQATVQTQGSVTVNGSVVPSSTTIFAGDKIQTAAGSTATISTQGTMVQMNPNSTAIFNDNKLDLGCGSALVTTTTGAVVRVSGITITPASQGATKIRVSQGDGSLKVTIEQGSAVVDDGAKHMLTAGQSFSRQGGGACGPLAAVPQGTTRIYIPAAAVAVASGVLAYCTVNGFCSQSSPAGP